MSEVATVLVLGATQEVGRAVIECLRQSMKPLFSIHAVSRQDQRSLCRDVPPPNSARATVQWHCLDYTRQTFSGRADYIISAGPINLLQRHLSHHKDSPPKAVWALSSASTDFKADSSSASERDQMAAIKASEAWIASYCEARDIGFQIFKTTMLYGHRDQNINRLADLIKRLGWVPVIGNGQRAPVHVDDVGQLFAKSLLSHSITAQMPSGIWRLQGGEALPYATLLQRIATARGLRCRIVTIPMALMSALLPIAHLLGQLRDVTQPMIVRQQMDLLVDDEPARKHLGWDPRHFSP